MSKDLVRLSQSHLNLIDICPPKFQQIYLDGRGTIQDLRQRESMNWGNQFHLLMQQQELALPIASILASDQELNSAFTALVSAVGLDTQDNVWREAEHCRTLSWGDFVLTVIYDLLWTQGDRAIILDWKTYRQPKQADKLAQNWQTRLYLYVLAETSEYAPEQIEMTYWFVRSGKPQKVTFKYSTPKHQQAKQDLTNLLTNLETWLQNYQLHQTDFPHRHDCEQKCPYHQFLCQDPEQQRELMASIEEIEEISI